MNNRINKDMMNIVRQAARYAFDDISVFDLCTWGEDKPIEWGVNWCARGTQDAGAARDYAERLAQAAAIAEMLTGLKMVQAYEQDKGLAQVAEKAGIETAERCYKNIELLVTEYIKALDADGLKAIALNR